MLSMEQLASCGVVPVVVLNDVKDAVPTAKALLRGGINVMEITFRTAAARDCIAKVAAEVPEIIAGAGTVVNVEQAREAVAAGAKFLVSPALTRTSSRKPPASTCPSCPAWSRPARS